MIWGVRTWATGSAMIPRIRVVPVIIGPPSHISAVLPRLSSIRLFTPQARCCHLYAYLTSYLRIDSGSDLATALRRRKSAPNGRPPPRPRPSRKGALAANAGGGNGGWDVRFRGQGAGPDGRERSHSARRGKNLLRSRRRHRSHRHR